MTEDRLDSMDSRREAQIQELFQAACQLPAGERDSFVAVRCGDDAGLRRQVMDLVNRQSVDFSDYTRSAAAEDAGAIPTASPLMPGAAVGPYQIEGPLGKGGMGEVYRARDTRLGRPVAVKFLPDAMAVNQALLERFRREAQAISTLNHPNVCTVYDVGDQAGRPYLVMELMEGQTLKARIAERGFSNEEIFEVIIPILDALETAHAAGIVHRDIKPANIFITRRGVVKILDFGLAKSTGAEPAAAAAVQEILADPGSTFDTISYAAVSAIKEGLTVPGTTLGTLSYMAPEQARGGTVDARSDLFACGVVLYQMATGTLPFTGDSGAATVEALLNRTPRPAHELSPGLSPAIEQVIHRALQKDPQARFQSAADMRAEVLRAKGILESQNAPPVPPAGHAGRWKAVAAGVAALGLAGIAALYFGAPKRAVTSPSEYVQITDFSDSVSAPSLSADGRMVTFLRGGNPFLTNEQIYVKLLPNGESMQITNEPREKYNPVFAPDGSRVAYTVMDLAQGSWETWTAPVTGGAATRLMRNAAGLSWIGKGRILFSEIQSGTLLHMGIVTSQESRLGEREIYFPEHVRAMAHYSYLSPDQKSILAVEMDPAWQPCKLVAMDNPSTRGQVGPAGPCTAAGWSPDGKWMYFSAEMNGSNHLWRQAFPSGVPEQITTGPGEERGLAVAPDGKSLISSVGAYTSSVWVHDAAGERPLSPEGSATHPRVSGDGKRVYYLLRKKTSSASELWFTELGSGASSPALTGVPLIEFAISRDGQQVAFTTRNGSDFQISIAPLDGSAPPRPVVHGGDRVCFGAAGELIFRQFGAHAYYLARVKTDGTGLERIIDEPVLDLHFTSPDGKWATVSGVGQQGVTIAVSLKDRTRQIICVGPCAPSWSTDGAHLFVTMHPTPAHASPTLVFPIAPGAGLPALPAEGLGQHAGEEFPEIPKIRQDWPTSGPDPKTYAFVKSDFVGNLFRIPLH